jgi:hypothetical protein
MAETQGIEKVLEKLAQILTGKGSSEVLDILEELEKSSQLKKDPGIPKQSGKTTNLGNFVNLAPTSNEVSRSNWILDSGASTHVTGRSEFASYASYPPTHKETIQTADGTYQPAMHSVYYIAFNFICSIVSGEFGVYELLG